MPFLFIGVCGIILQILQPVSLPKTEIKNDNNTDDEEQKNRKLKLVKFHISLAQKCIYCERKIFH